MPEQTLSEEAQIGQGANGRTELSDLPKDVDSVPAVDELEPLPVSEPYTPRLSLLHIALGCILLTGFLLRISAARHLSSHVDESASILAARMVAEKGVPVFPSGTFYSQGATLSYI